MDIVVDTVMYGLQPNGGVPRIFSSILPIICDMDPAVNFHLIVSNKSRQKLPAHERIKSFNYNFDKRVLNKLGLNRMLQPWLDETRIKFQFQRGKKRIWHSTYFTDLSFWEGRRVLTVHDFIYEKFPEYTQFPDRDMILERKKACINNADIIIANSQTTANDLINLYNIEENRVTPIYLGINDTFLNNAISKTEKREPSGFMPYLLYIGFRDGYKNFKFFIDAFSKWGKHKNFKVILVGPPVSEKEFNYYKSAGISDNVICRTNISDNELVELYKDASAYILPSVYEGFGIPLLEAVACDCPIIASDIPSTKEIIEDYPVYFELGNTESLISSFEQISSGKVNTGRLKGLKEKYVSKYTWKSAAEKTLEVYKSLSA